MASIQEPKSLDSFIFFMLCWLPQHTQIKLNILPLGRIKMTLKQTTPKFNGLKQLFYDPPQVHGLGIQAGLCWVALLSRTVNKDTQWYSAVAGLVVTYMTPRQGWQEGWAQLELFPRVHRCGFSLTAGSG